MNAAERKEATKRAAAKALLSLDNDGARAILSDPAHTAGPWTAQKNGNLPWTIYSKPDKWNPRGQIICQIVAPFHEAEDACLIGAAPELLDQLEEIVEAWNFGDIDTDAMFSAMAHVRLLIKKARAR